MIAAAAALIVLADDMAELEEDALDLVRGEQVGVEMGDELHLSILSNGTLDREWEVVELVQFPSSRNQPGVTLIFALGLDDEQVVELAGILSPLAEGADVLKPSLLMRDRVG